MKTTDYSKVADVYDNNSFRFDEVQMDTYLADFLQNYQRQSYSVMDLACGTGIYLNDQTLYFESHPIHWHGLDASKEMLSKAEEKLEGVTLVRGLAEDLPYGSEAFDFISNNYAFHHFTKKGQVIDELYRVLKKNGIYKLHNINIHDMENWWVYHYFPAAFEEDLDRFWQKEVIFNELTSRGFTVRIESSFQMENIKVADYLDHAENRDISVLTLISDEDYYDGLTKMKYDVEMDPDKAIVNDFSELVCIAKKD
ncbi:class I SAM-dependent methyltransferase [Halobacillus shinanisalinarum]|uniref:Class I SAM-dependent methyltransferase n=1 Tax=Halobacillus shinanisalinarum TaxID=2932258 RepID=A0ABY4GVN1_9BACI|nr:class I SAM-dependent methyltransferase [Halobacillus shinanisalinarum]UOQ91775.1 class I SAM-dependent methyltransferase [Halobacillus shinanisalinarum]